MCGFAPAEADLKSRFLWLNVFIKVSVDQLIIGMTIGMYPAAQRYC